MYAKSPEILQGSLNNNKITIMMISIKRQSRKIFEHDSPNTKRKNFKTPPPNEFLN